MIRSFVKELKLMKTQMTPITVLAHFEEDGAPHPLRFKLADRELKIEQVVSVTEDRLCGNKMLCFRCQSEIKGELKPYEIKFEVGTCKWFLFKKEGGAVKLPLLCRTNFL